MIESTGITRGDADPLRRCDASWLRWPRSPPQAETQWVQNMEADSNVRLRIDGVVYELRAERVTDPAEIARFGKAWTSQSSLMRDPSELEQAWVYRLHAR